MAVGILGRPVSQPTALTMLQCVGITWIVVNRFTRDEETNDALVFDESRVNG